MLSACLHLSRYQFIGLDPGWHPLLGSIYKTLYFSRTNLNFCYSRRKVQWHHDPQYWPQTFQIPGAILA